MVQDKRRYVLRSLRRYLASQRQFHKIIIFHTTAKKNNHHNHQKLIHAKEKKEKKTMKAKKKKKREKRKKKNKPIFEETNRANHADKYLFLQRKNTRLAPEKPI